MEAQRIQDIEDYCQNVPQTHNFRKKLVPDGLRPKIVMIMRELLMLIENEGYLPNRDVRKIWSKYKYQPKKVQMAKIYYEWIDNEEIEQNDILESFLKIKQCRSISGVSVVTVFLSAFPNGQTFSCKWDCKYCPKEPNMPRSYLFEEPGVLRAIQNDFDCVRQMYCRLDMYRINGTPRDKLEVLILGGTIHSYPNEYLEEYMRDIFYAANTYPDKDSRERLTLQEEQYINETSKSGRVIGITVETRPDCITRSELIKFRRWGVTRVQIGVQHTDDRILRNANRGCYLRHIIRAIKLLRESCFKFDIHLMPNLPGSTPEIDKRMIDYVLANLHPDQVKMYPTEVVPFTDLLEDYKAGTYKPYPNEDLEDVVIYYKERVHPWIRNNRIIRDIPNEYIIDGVKSANQRQEFHKLMKSLGKKCHCIRCREAGRHPEYSPYDGEMVVRHYEASGGHEFFLSWESKDREAIFGFSRLRLSKDAGMIFPELRRTAMIRELHVYGHTTAVADKRKKNIQHLGIGKRLMSKAEQIARRYNILKMSVIAGIGTRKYYEKLGYHKEETFMVKDILDYKPIIFIGFLFYLVIFLKLLSIFV